VEKFVGIFFAFYAITLFWTPDDREGWEIFSSYVPYIVLIVFLCPLLVVNDKNIKEAVFSLLLMSSAAAIASLFAPWKGRGILTIDDYTGNPLALASAACYISIIFAILIYSNLSSKKILPLFIFGIPLVIVGLVVAYNTGSRGQLLGMILLVGLQAMLRASISIPNTLLVTATLVVGYFAIESSGVLGYLKEGRWSVDQLKNAMESDRLPIIYEIMDKFIERGPLVWFAGAGACSSIILTGTYPHLVALEVLVESGFVGLFLFSKAIWMLAKSGLNHLRLLDKSRNTESSVLWVMFSLFLFNLLLTFKQGSILGSSDFFAFVVLSARSFKIVSQKSDSRSYYP
jgi:hypothetical protein